VHLLLTIAMGLEGIAISSPTLVGLSDNIGH
jgi:hypothetical protein